MKRVKAPDSRLWRYMDPWNERIFIEQHDSGHLYSDGYVIVYVADAGRWDGRRYGTEPKPGEMLSIRETSDPAIEYKAARVARLWTAYCDQATIGLMPTPFMFASDACGYTARYFERPEDAEGPRWIAIDTKYLAIIEPLCGPRDVTYWQSTDPAGPICVNSGDEWIAVLMPIQTGDDRTCQIPDELNAQVSEVPT